MLQLLQRKKPQPLVLKQSLRQCCYEKCEKMGQICLEIEYLKLTEPGFRTSKAFQKEIQGARGGSRDLGFGIWDLVDQVLISGLSFVTILRNSVSDVSVYLSRLLTISYHILHF